MSLKSMLHTRETENTGLSNQRNNLFKSKSTLKGPLAQNLIVHLVSGLSMPFCKEIIKNPNKSGVEAKDEEIISAETNVNSNAGADNTHPINLGCQFSRQRQRTVSDHSDDICFLEDDGSNTQVCDYFATYDDDEEYDDGEDYDDCEEAVDSEDDSDAEDESATKNEIGRKGSNHNNTINANITTRSNNPKTQARIKKVRFNLNVEVHTMYAWSFAYKSARKGHWENFARDRDRFRRRIENTSNYLNPILKPEHRSFIYNTRFTNEVCM